MTETAQKTPDAPESKAILRDYLAQCRDVVEHCLKTAKEYDDPEQAVAASRLIRTCLDVVLVLEGKPPTSHNITVTHISAPASPSGF